MKLTAIVNLLCPQLDNGFYRNDRYRSTMLTGGYQSTLPTPSRYVNSGGSVTPTPRSRYGQLSHGSSQNSLNSTNPFDDDIDDDTISRVTTVDGIDVRKPGRKKRRAPPPPPPRSSTPLLSGNVSISHINNFIQFLFSKLPYWIKNSMSLLKHVLRFFGAQI